ncbi:MAG TPA: periplasmic heavy metal sensor [Pyrinomonadaceae bacterium]|jgi:Spy/CpxP family protein refolding chaperone|nr:periplasmic heavy metal sensor [Pyrinomonadaceae bacterium]
MKFRTLILLFSTLLLFTTANAQDATAPPIEDSINQLRLTPEQRQRIRTIFEENKTERQTTNRRLREAQFSLTQALDAEPIDENAINQRVNDVAAAQAAQMRMRIQIELKIRRELSPEQLTTWRRLRLQMRDFMDAQRPFKRRPAAQGLAPRRNVRPR